MKEGVEPAREADLSALRSLGSTGSPLPAEGFEWVVRAREERPVALLHQRRHRPLHRVRGRLPGAAGVLRRDPGALPRRRRRGLGRGRPAAHRRGGRARDHRSRCPRCRSTSGTTPAAERYRESYFETYPGVWRHGDWIKINERGGAVIYGRSDSTINRQGVRMGTSELYSAVEGVPEVMDSLVVDVPTPDGLGLHDVALHGAWRRAPSWTTELEATDPARACASTARHATCRTASWPWPRCRARCPARSSRCP